MNALLHPRWVIALVLLLLSNIARASVAESAPPAAPTRWVIGLSPFLDKGVKDDVFRRIVGFVLEGMPLGSSLDLYDAYHLQTIATLAIPDQSAFRSAKTRANQLKDPLHQLKRFLATEPDRPESPRLSLDQAIRFPQFLDFLSAHRSSDPGSLAVIVLGSPLYLDHKEPGFSMVDGYFPSDAHLGAGREDSVFGLKERTGALPQVRVYFGYFGDPWVSQIHEEKISRFWSLYLEGQGARLSAFCGDLPTVFEAARNGSEANPAGPRYQLNPTQTKIAMLRIIRRAGEADWIARDTVRDAAQHPPETRVGPMKIGIRWQGDLDLDLYATPKPGAETLFFEHPRSAEGYYFKDHRSSPGGEYEFIEFESPVDVSQVEARINYYRGTSSEGPTGEIRIEFAGRIYTEPFSLVARQGNEGRSGPKQTAFWTRIDVPTVLKLTRRSATE